MVFLLSLILSITILSTIGIETDRFNKLITNKIAKSKNIEVVERKIKPEEMKDFIGCFLTGTAAEVTPVSQIDDYNFKVCNVISDLNESYQNLVRKKDTAA